MIFTKNGVAESCFVPCCVIEKLQDILTNYPNSMRSLSSNHSWSFGCLDYVASAIPTSVWIPSRDTEQLFLLLGDVLARMTSSKKCLPSWLCECFSQAYTWEVMPLSLWSLHTLNMQCCAVVKPLVGCGSRTHEWCRIHSYGSKSYRSARYKVCTCQDHNKISTISTRVRRKIQFYSRIVVLN